MTLDEPSNPFHAAMLQKDPADLTEPEWKRLARLTEAEDRKAYRRAVEERAACESVEAEETRWLHPEYGIFALQERDRPAVHYRDNW